jgi:tetratricopeptide (TPR) repeat protein
MQTVQQMLESAAKYYESGHLEEAQQLYREVLERDPEEAAALHGLGLLAYKMRQCEEAANYLRRATARVPGSAAYHSNLAVVLASLGRDDEAFAEARQALELRPDYVDPMFVMGDLLHSRGDSGEAVAFYRRALALRPDYGYGQCVLGRVLAAMGDPGAAAAFRRAVELDPAVGEGWLRLAKVLQDKDQFEEAVGAFRKAFSVGVDFLAAYAPFARALRGLGRSEEAAGVERQARSIQSEQGGVSSGFDDPSDTRWAGYQGPPLDPSSKAWEALFVDREWCVIPAESPALRPLKAAAQRPGLPPYDELFSLNGQRLPCWLEKDLNPPDGPWLTASTSYPAYFGLFEALARSEGPTRLLEIGVRTGYVGAVFAKAMRGPATYVGVDPNLYEANGLALAAQTLRRLRSARGALEYFLINGYSWHKSVQESLVHSGPFDIVHVDGDHTVPAKLMDLELARRVCPEGHVLVDDFTHIPRIREAVARACAIGLFNQFTFVPTFRGMAILKV